MSNALSSGTAQSIADLRQLVSRLVQESERVILARARSERDVRGFITTGLAIEQLRVGALLKDIFQVALEVDWQSQKVRRSLSPLPPIAVAIPNLSLIERLQVKQFDDNRRTDLDLTVAEANPVEMDAEFWQAFHALLEVQVDVSNGCERSIETLRKSCGELLGRFHEHECRHYFRHVGYRCTSP